MEDIKSKRTFRSEDYDMMLIVDAGSTSGTINIDGIIRQLWLKA